MTEAFIFDKKAKAYDKEFSDTYIGKIQRKNIHDFIQRQLKDKKGLEILEINCGTGEDISFLRQFGRVTATDVSEEMIKIAAGKNTGPHIEFQMLDLNQPVPAGKKYDLVFSNFGGLNCIPPQRLKALNTELMALLNPGGEMFLVLMHTWSLPEFMYFFTRLNFKKAFRRLSRKAGFHRLNIHYYSCKNLVKIFSGFVLQDTYSTGILLSGAYMNKPGRFFKIGEKKIQWLKPLMGADHIVYHWVKK